MVERMVDEKVENDQQSLESMSIDEESDNDMKQEFTYDESEKYKLVHLHTQHGAIEIPKGLINMGIQHVFTPEILNEFVDKLESRETERLKKYIEPKTELKKAIDDLGKLTSKKEIKNSNSDLNMVHKNPFTVVDRLIKTGEFRKSEYKYRKYCSHAAMLRKKQHLQELIVYMEKKEKENKNHGELDAKRKELKRLEAKEFKLTSALSGDKFMSDEEMLQQLLLDPLSDTEKMSVIPSNSDQKEDKNEEEKEKTDISEKQSPTSITFIKDLGCEKLNNMVKRLQDEESELDHQEELQEYEKTLRDKKIQEAVDNEANAEETKNPRDHKILDWKEEVTQEISTEFRKRCQARLKKSDNLNWIAYSDRFTRLKTNKNMQTIRKPSKAWVRCYAEQEQKRYENPTKPWLYYNPDETTSIVAPVLRKMGQATNKAREHNALKRDRPPYVTILCLVRDAAARLPDGVGTRADICALLRCSQYLEKKSLDSQINSVVSGALDRLHYENDPCVKYDSEKRLWIYLHKNRQVDDPLWQSMVPQDTPNTVKNNSYKPPTFFENNLPAYESDEEVQMVRNKGGDYDDGRADKESRSEFQEESGAYFDRNPSMLSGSHKQSRNY